MIRIECFVIIIHVVQVASQLNDYSMNMQDLTNLCNKKVRYDHHAKKLEVKHHRIKISLCSSNQ